MEGIEAVCGMTLRLTIDDLDKAISQGVATDDQGAIGWFMRETLEQLDHYTGGAKPTRPRKVRLKRLPGPGDWFSYEIVVRGKYNVEDLGAPAYADYLASLGDVSAPVDAAPTGGLDTWDF